MSSREIAELTDKEHAHVMRDIRTMLAELGLAEGGYLQNWIHPQNNQTYPEFQLPRDLTDCLLTGYSAVARMRVIKRWHQLEQQVALPPKRTRSARLPAPEARAAQEAFFTSGCVQAHPAVQGVLWRFLEAAADVCKALSLANSRDAVSRLDDDEKKYRRDFRRYSRQPEHHRHQRVRPVQPHPDQ